MGGSSTPLGTGLSTPLGTGVPQGMSDQGQQTSGSAPVEPPAASADQTAVRETAAETVEQALAGDVQPHEPHAASEAPAEGTVGSDASRLPFPPSDDQ